MIIKVLAWFDPVTIIFLFLPHGMITRFQSNEDIFSFGRKLRDELLATGKSKEAEELTEVVDGYWTTASEALGEMMNSLTSVRATVVDSLSKDVLEDLDVAVAQIRDAFDRANNPKLW